MARNSLYQNGQSVIVTGNSESESEDPVKLMNEFQSLYSEKIKRIEENCENPTQAKLKILEEWINDLSAQNYALIQTVEALEREALQKVEVINELTAKANGSTHHRNVKSDLYQLLELLKKIRLREPYCLCCFKFKTITYQDIFGCSPVVRCEEGNCLAKSHDLLASQKKKSSQRCSKLKGNLNKTEKRSFINDELKDRASQATDFIDIEINDLKNSFKENEMALKKYSIDLEKKLAESNKERESLEDQNYGLAELQKKVKELECELQQKTEQVCCLQQQAAVGDQVLEDKVRDLTVRNELLSCQLLSKESEIDDLKKCIQEKETNQYSDPVRCALEASLKEKERVISDLKKCNEKNVTLLDCQRKQVDMLSAEKSDLLIRESDLKNEICELKQSVCEFEGRIKELQCYICEIEGQVQGADNSGIISSYEESENIQELMKALSEKQCIIDKLEAERERFFTEIDVLEQKYKKREEHLVSQYKALSCQLKMKEDEIYMLSCGVPQRDQVVVKQNISRGSRSDKGKTEIEKLQFKMKDLQKALTGEIADKHDEIRRLKDDIKELEDKLRQSEKQTHFRDDLIKELRKEVKLGRAKESLAEMLGLKGTPRAGMKDEIDNLTSQLEELKAHNLALETRLAECNLPAVLTLRSKLNQAEGSLLAMCNKIDYVRRYLENLKGDEEMSLKCGIEALLNELRDDVEWNRQTRRNLSLDEGTSVIVISHRSRSLPDNSLHRLTTKSQTDSAVSVFNKSLSNNAQFPMLQESFHDCKNYIQKINELENNFDETNKEISNTWNSLKMWSQGSGDSLLKSFHDIIRSSVEGNEELARLATQVESLLDCKEMQNEHLNLDYLEENLLELCNQLEKVDLIANSSCSDINNDPDINSEIGSLSKKITMSINDSLSLISNMKEKKDARTSKVPAYFKGCLEEIMGLFNSVIGHKKSLFEKLIALQTQQVQFMHTLQGRISEYDVGLSSFHGSAENVKGETKKLFSVLLSKESEIKKQFDEIQHLKSLLSTNFYENRNSEVSSLRKVVSNKDLKATDKEDLIHNLRSINYTLRRAKISKSSPSINCAGDIQTDLSEKLQELEETISIIKGSLSTILIYLVGNHDKISHFQEKSKALVQSLAETHQEITANKDVISYGRGNNPDVRKMDHHLNEAIYLVEMLLDAVENFLCDGEKPDLHIISDTLQKNMLKLVHVGDLIKKSAEYEHNMLKNITEENVEIRKQIQSLEVQLLEFSNLQGAEHEAENSVIKKLREDLEKATTALLSIRQEYAQLKIQKENMETRNQKVMEELQTKVCTLQEAASKHQSNESDNVSELQSLVSSLQNKISDLESVVYHGEEVIQTLKQHYMKSQVKNEQLAKRLYEMKEISKLQSQEIEKLQNQICSLTKEVEEFKLSEAVHIANSKKLSQELEALMDDKQNVEENIYSIQDELFKKSEELKILQEICKDHQNNLRKFIAENENLKAALSQDEKNRVKLQYELDQLEEQIKAANEREILINGQLVKKNQVICQLKVDKQKLENYIEDLNTILREIDYGGSGESKDIVLRQEETIRMLTARLKRMAECISERDEFFKLIEKQLEASTQFLLDDSDDLKDNQYRQTTKQDTSNHLEYYKVRLQHAMDQNWKLVTLVNKLRSIRFSHPREDSTTRYKDSFYYGTRTGSTILYQHHVNKEIK